LSTTSTGLNARTSGISSYCRPGGFFFWANNWPYQTVDLDLDRFELRDGVSTNLSTN
jgi:hypothetical protein